MKCELFSRSTDPYLPLNEQEYFELQSDDLGIQFQTRFSDSSGGSVRHRFLVLEAHAIWSELDGQIMWDGFDYDECSTIEEAQRRYEERRIAIFDKGFIYSDKET